MSSPEPTEQDAPRWLLPALTVAAVITRAVGAWRGGVEVDGDEAVIGLMALDMLQGRFTPFYWGQAYMAPVESAVLAPVLFFTGPSLAAIRVVAGAFFLLFIHSTFLLARRTLGWRAGAWACAALIAGPLFLHIWSLKLRGGFVSLCAAGQYLLCWVLDRAEQGNRKSPLLASALLGAAMGALMYWYFLAVEYLLVALLVLARARPGPWSWRRVGAGAAAFLVPLIPAVIYNLSPTSRWGSINYFLEDPPGGPGTMLERARTVFSSGLVILAGALPPWQGSLDALAGWRAWLARLVLLPVVLGTLVLAVGGLRGVVSWARARQGWTRGAAPLSMLALACISAPVVTQFGTWAEPRFLLPLCAPLWIAAGSVFVRQRVMAWVTLGVMATATSVLAWDAPPRLWHTPVHRAELDRPFPPAGELLAALDRDHVVAVYGDYWLCMPLLYLSEQRIACRNNSARTPWMKKRVQERTHVEKAWIYDRGRTPLAEFLETLDQVRLDAEVSHVGDLVLVHHLRQRQGAVPRHAMAWTASRSADPVVQISDLDVTARWTSGIDQSKADVTLTAVFDRERVVERVRLLCNDGGDFPRDLVVEATLDGITWTRVGERRDSMRPRGGVTLVALAPMLATQLRLTARMNAGGQSWWSVAEVTLDEAAAPPMPQPAPAPTP